MVNDSKNMINQLKCVYKKWNNSSLIFDNLKDGYISIDNTLNSHIDSISIYLKVLNNNKVKLSDFGYTNFHLQIRGIHLKKSNKKIWHIFISTLKYYGIHYNKADANLYAITSINQIPSVRIKMLRAILHIEDIQYLYQ